MNNHPAFIYLVTHGKVKRCWHEVVESIPQVGEYCACGNLHRFGGYCGSNPTPTLDFLVQRCEEEGWNFIEIDRCNGEVMVGKHRAMPLTSMFWEKAGTPQEALMIAIAKALGWKG